MLKKYIFLPFLLLIVLPTTGVFAETVDYKAAVRDFYMNYERHMNHQEFDQARALVDLYVAPDFGHYDDGTLAYGKEQFLATIDDRKEKNIKSDLQIEIENVYEAEVTGELRLYFKIFESYGEGSDLRKTALRCHDSIRILPDQKSFELYRCDCKTIEYNPI